MGMIIDSLNFTTINRSGIFNIPVRTNSNSSREVSILIHGERIMMTPLNSPLSIYMNHSFDYYKNWYLFRTV